MNIKRTIVLITVILIGLQFSPLKASENECFEKVSRSIFKFNQGLDNVLVGPIARTYNKLPEKVRGGVGNFTSNISTLLSMPNQILQGNLKGAGDAFGSFVINTTVGILGFADVASSLGVKDTQEDLSQTLGSYGISGGCYFVLPVIGPTTVRDSLSMIGDTYLDPFATMTWRQKEVFDNVGKKREYIGVKATDAINFRAENDSNFESLERNSLDVYASTKSLYLQNKKNKINNSTSSDDEDWGNLDN